jgi:hypothetical protein
MRLSVCTHTQLHGPRSFQARNMYARDNGPSGQSRPIALGYLLISGCIDIPPVMNLLFPEHE